MKHFCVSLVFFFSPFFRGQVQRNYNYHSEIQTISLVAHNSHDYSVICSFYALAPTWWLQTDQLWFLKRYPSTPVSKTAFRSRQTNIVVDGCAKRCDAIFKLFFPKYENFERGFPNLQRNRKTRVDCCMISVSKDDTFPQVISTRDNYRIQKSVKSLLWFMYSGSIYHLRSWTSHLWTKQALWSPSWSVVSMA